MVEQPDDLVELKTVVNELEAGMVESVLAEAGIQASHRTAKGIYLAMGMSSLNPSTIMVRREDVERANQALSANKQDSVDLDWDEVDVGEPEDAIAREIAAGAEPETRGGKHLLSGIASLLLAFPVALLVGVVVEALSGAKMAAIGIGIIAFTMTARALHSRSSRSRNRRGRHDADVFSERG